MSGSRTTKGWACTGALLALTCTLGAASAEDWPGFRGPTGQGLSAENELPVRWSASENVAWKTAVPGEGWSSPVVCKGRVFLTTATDKGASCRVLCLDRAGGRILWDKEVYRQSPGHRNPRYSYATSTPATDGERIYALFGDGGLVALDYEGHLLWKRFSRLDVIAEVRLVNREHELLKLVGHGFNLTEDRLRVFGRALPFLNHGIFLDACLQGGELLLDVRTQEEGFGEFHRLIQPLNIESRRRRRPLYLKPSLFNWAFSAAM